MRTFLILLLLSFSALANRTGDAVGTAAFTAGATAGFVAGTQHGYYNSIIHQELKGWSDKRTDTTTELSNDCGLNSEFHLVGNHARNYLLIGLSNTKAENVVVQNSKIEFVYDNERKRFPGWLGHPSDYEVRAGWWFVGYIPFPTKEEFHGTDVIEAKIPVLNSKGESCVVTATFNKKEEILNENISYSIFEYYLEGGVSLFELGSTRKLGSPESLFGLGLNFYLKPNHGFGFHLLSETGFKGSDKERVYREFEKGRNYRANTFMINLHYIYRHFFSPRFTLNYEPALGNQVVHDEKKFRKQGLGDPISSAFVISQKFMFNWNFSSIRSHPVLNINFFGGVGPIYIWIPAQKINGESIAGHRFGLLARFGIGF
ncbi:MAG: hypothetical protein ACLGHN_08315 [Bacteriovoracia bacterium]